MAKQIQAIIVDLDKTLLHTDKTLSHYSITVLNRCINHGVAVMVATARPERAIQEYWKLIPFCGAVVSNGARVIYGGHTAESPIPETSAKILFGYLENNKNRAITLETGDAAYSSKPVPDFDTIVCPNLLEAVKREGAYKFILHYTPEEAFSNDLTQRLPDDLYCTISSGNLLQIMHKTATKWNGIQKLLQFMKIVPEDVLYFGDDYDDLEPIRQCGIGIAVANAVEEVKAAAKNLTKSNDADGVASYIEKYILEHPSF